MGGISCNQRLFTKEGVGLIICGDYNRIFFVMFSEFGLLSEPFSDFKNMSRGILGTFND